MKKITGKLYALIALVGALMVSGIAHAQATVISLMDVDLDWAAFATSLATKATAVIAVAIGIGLGFWVIRLIYRKFKSFARG